MSLYSAAFLINSALALDPVSLIFGDIEHPPAQNNVELISQLKQTQLDQSGELRFSLTGIQSDTRINIPNGYLTLDINARQQHYFMDNGNHQGELSLPDPLVQARLRVGNNAIEVSPEQLTLKTAAALWSTQVGLECTERTYPLRLSTYWREAEIDLDIQPTVAQRSCSLLLSRGAWSASASTQLFQQELRAGGVTLGYKRADFTLNASHQTVLLHGSDHWQIDTSFSGYSQFDAEGQRARLQLGYRNWQGHYLYQQWRATLFNRVSVQDEVINSIGKGQYYLNGTAQLQAQSLWLQPPAWQFGHWRVSPALGLADVQDIDIHSDLYEPLLFLGLPVLTSREQINLQSGSLAAVQTQVQWQRNGMQFTTLFSQLVPFNTRTLEDPTLSDNDGNNDNDNDNDNDNGGDGDNEPVTDKASGSNKKTGPLWPGFSITVELKLYF
jgi:hypothetical protein